ncbi:hypothetical protein JTB14_015343 [Gonioctena quinquepunctata]|nr:hypothetical protein JTB14_015343 [Gonioctena quinquepunctata]
MKKQRTEQKTIVEKHSQKKDIEARNIADQQLASVASERLKAPDAKLGEKITSFGISNIMNMKSKLGMRLKKKAFAEEKKEGGELRIAKEPKIKRTKRVIKTPKKVVFFHCCLPLLGALGAVGCGAASITPAVNQ